MSEEMYFVIRNSDGDTQVTSMTKEKLLKRITPDEDGHIYYGNDVEFISLAGLKVNEDTNYWGGMLIIKGTVCVPKPVEVVREYEV